MDEDGGNSGGDAVSGDQILLRSLAPEFDEDQHRMYADLLVDAIENKPSVRNIALTGPYGTGKSSILGEVADEYRGRVVEISFSTVGKEPAKGSAAAIGPDAETEVKANPAAATPTNRIEKEIVKQILYRDDPSRMRGSRFRRITRFRWRQQAVFGLVVGLLAVGALFLTGLDKPFMAAAGGDGVQLWLSHGLLWLLLAGSVVVVRWLTHNRVFLEKLTAGPATVSLSPHSSSYFDEYLDEIVYYFEVSRRDIVVFEDIDRFDDVHIFEALRALNSLLNTAKQVRRRRSRRETMAKGIRGLSALWCRKPLQPVKFVYALRDSVFEKLGEASDSGEDLDDARAEIERANRTKFFELVIPVVPFITHRNARDLMTDAMRGTDVSKGLIDLAARHVADMRLIRNMRNEYDVFARKLLAAPAQERLRGLDADRLFAMVLYKNVHMSDFEKIRFGDSQLDGLHRQWRQLVSDNIAHETSTAREVAAKLESLDSAAIHSERLGARLEQVAQAIGRGSQHGRLSAPVTIGNVTMNSAKIRQADTWTTLVRERLPVRIDIGPNYYTEIIQFDDLPALLGMEISLDGTLEAERVDLARTVDESRERIRFLRHHTWQELSARPEFTLPALVDGAKTFGRLAEAELGSELAQQLVANGYINDYFALYVSVYYGEHLRLDALNYIVQHIDKGVADPLYPLTGDDVDAILAEKGQGVLLDASMYNHCILDHLLERRPQPGRTLLGQVASWGTPEKAFSGDYLLHGKQREKFIEGLAPLVPAVFDWLATVETAEASLRSALVDAALRSWKPGVAYSLGADVRTYFEEHAGDFASLTAPGRPEDAAKAMSLIASSRAALPSLAHLSPDALRVAADKDCYLITSENLRILTRGEDNALDTIREAAVRVYDHVLEELGQYMTAVQGSRDGGPTVGRPESFAQILHDIDSAHTDPGILAAVIDGAAPECTVPDLSSVPPSAWEALAADHRTAATFANVTALIENAGGVSPGLSALLEAERAVTGIDGANDSERADLAVRLLSSREALPDPELRVWLAGSLVDPGIQLPASSIEPEPGSLIGMLLERGVIADDPSAFSDSLMPDWPTREAAIEASKRFVDYVAPELLPAAVLPELFASARVRREVKRRVLGELGAYAAGGDGAGIRAAAAYANREDIPLDYPRLLLAVDAKADKALLVRLMAASSLAEQEMRDLLHRLGGNYSLIARHGTKRPLLPDDPAHRTILDQLTAHGVVSRYQPEDEGTLRVFLRQS